MKNKKVILSEEVTTMKSEISGPLLGKENGKGDLIVYGILR